MTQAHVRWLGAVADAVAAEYELTRRNLVGRARAQQRGHHYEALFRRLLQGWLPPQYEVGTRKYLLLERAVNRKSYSCETDLVIFHPSYPRELRERSEVLLSGVVAAFSVKSELSRGKLRDAITEARVVREGFERKVGTEIGELISPLIYGVLAHTHKLPGDEPRAAVTDALLAETQKDEPPRGQLDLVCVADLDCWYRTVNIAQNPIRPGPSAPSEGDSYYDFWHSAHQTPDTTGAAPLQNPHPIATLVIQLWAKLAVRDPQLKQIADGLSAMRTGAHLGSGHLPRRLDGVISSYLHERIFPTGSSRWFM
ncbi:hypothetical protein MPRM_06400 [Mycobacterium parmense]|uniref:DUF6602 domain-containing protein n=1 Tax=Mycobacterium parmense TaxID=185642 RepID=A0A7I7YNU1_9MYCO|nr:hypothetical protein MPRM_06400 [Mycobacterium parmense]